MKLPKIESMQSPNGNQVANQFIIRTGREVIFQSYSTIIAIRDWEGKITLCLNK